MTERATNDRFADRLLRQEPAIHSPRYQEHRMELELQLERAKRNEARAGYVVAAALVVALLGMFAAGSHYFGSPDPFEQDANPLSVSIGAIHIVATIIFWLGLAAYVSRLRPAVRQAKENLLFESIRELRLEVQELRTLVAAPKP